MMKELLLVVCGCLMLAVSTDGWCSWSRVNGCSVPGNLPFFYKNHFRDACNRHDFCYYCGMRRGFSKRWCDIYFYYNMKKTCKWYTPYCSTFAVSYFYVVWGHGHRYYSNPSPWWCSQSWVPSCMT